jgi:hypothetical protein
VIAHARYTVLQMAEVAVPRNLFGRILGTIEDLTKAGRAMLTATGRITGASNEKAKRSSRSTSVLWAFRGRVVLRDPYSLGAQNVLLEGVHSGTNPVAGVSGKRGAIQ